MTLYTPTVPEPDLRHPLRINRCDQRALPLFDRVRN